MKYQIFYLKPGRLSFGKHVIRPAKDYPPGKIPVFDEETDPITEGLRLLEKGGLVELRPFQKEASPKSAPIVEPENDTVDQDVDGGDVLSGEVEPVEVEVEPVEVEVEPAEVEVEPIEVEVELPQSYTEDDLRALSSKELSEICKEQGLSGYSGLKKEEKIALILGG
jgi:hypothetical protein